MSFILYTKINVKMYGFRVGYMLELLSLYDQQYIHPPLTFLIEAQWYNTRQPHCNDRTLRSYKKSLPKVTPYFFQFVYGSYKNIFANANLFYLTLIFKKLRKGRGTT